MSQIHSSAVVHKNVQLAKDVTIGPNCVIKSGVSIGSGTILEANVVIDKNVRIGEKNHFFANCVIGSQPQLLHLDPTTEIGGLIIGDGNLFHEQVTIHPSIYPGEFTEIGNDNFFMIGVHLGHDCNLEDKIVLSNYVQIGGHCKIEIGAWLSGLAASHQFVTIGKWCYVAGLTGIIRDIPPFVIVSGHYNPQKIRGVNIRGLKRAGMSEEQKEKIFQAYKKLYRQKGVLLQNAIALSKENGLDENVRAMIDVITKSSEHRYGRYLETLREH
jgi:UDP-N-acetylglucosamine acyltransferase